MSENTSLAERLKQQKARESAITQDLMKQQLDDMRNELTDILKNELNATQHTLQAENAAKHTPARDPRPTQYHPLEQVQDPHTTAAYNGFGPFHRPFWRKVGGDALLDGQSTQPNPKNHIREQKHP